jgi:hypothetical protein
MGTVFIDQMGILWNGTKMDAIALRGKFSS